MQLVWLVNPGDALMCKRQSWLCPTATAPERTLKNQKIFPQMNADGHRLLKD